MIYFFIGFTIFDLWTIDASEQSTVKIKYIDVAKSFLFCLLFAPSYFIYLLFVKIAVNPIKELIQVIYKKLNYEK